MNTSPLKRPHFGRPPIYEQAISLSFDRLTDLQIVDYGLFWTLLKDEFPETLTAARRPVSVELFDGSEPQFSMELVPAMQLPRAMFRNEASGEIVQIQDDLFAFNWVKATADAQYPRFEKTSARLWELFALFEKFWRDKHDASPTLRQCELTNVNIIPVTDFGTDFGDMGRAFIIDPFEWNVPGLEAETYVRRRQHKMLDEAGRAVGRLHSVISPGFGPEGRPIFQFELTARSGPEVRTRDEAVQFFARAHDMINGAFLASVTPAMRAHWEEYDG